MGEPYRYTGKYNGGPMRIEAHDHEEGLAAVVIPGAKPVYVEGLDIPDVTNAMWRAAGQEPPVMLGRPDLASARDADGWVAFRGLQVRRSADGGVTFKIGGNAETLPEPMARQCAAVAVALADERPEPEPDPEDVKGMAAALAEAGALSTETPVERLAVAALRWMNAKAARDA